MRKEAVNARFQNDYYDLYECSVKSFAARCHVADVEKRCKNFIIEYNSTGNNKQERIHFMCARGCFNVFTSINYRVN
jgi:hypothetical protein